MEWYEAAFDRMYPILYSHRNEDEAGAVIDRYGGYLEGRQPVLDLGSGNGRYLEALERHGITAFGLDLSHYLLRTSVEQMGQRGKVVQGDMRCLPFGDGSFGGAINMFTSFGYFSVDMDNLLVFREVHRVLRRGGLFLFDFLNAERISDNLLARTERESSGYKIEEKRRIEAHGKYLVKQATITNAETGFREEIEERLRLYTRDELLLMFDSVGLHPGEVFGDYEGNAFVDGVSERVVVLAEKV